MPEEPSPSDPTPATEPPPSVLNYHQPRGDELEWVKVWTARNPVEANLAVAMLHERGIHARVDMENIATLGAWAGGAGSSTAVHVTRVDASAAREILLEIDRRRGSRSAAAKLMCPRCGSSAEPKRVMSIIRWIAIGCVPGAIAAMLLELPGTTAILIVLAAVLIIWPLKPRWRCSACGHKWIAPEPEEQDEEENDSDDAADGE